jgi:hypothetical protein
MAQALLAIKHDNVQETVRFLGSQLPSINTQDAIVLALALRVMTNNREVLL